MLLIVATLSWQSYEGFESLSRLQGLVRSRIDLGSQVGSSCTGSREVAGEYWLNEGAEDNLGSTSDWECEPKNKNELECVVEWEPVNGVDGALEDGEESKDNPVGKPLSVIGFADTEQCLQRIIPWDHEPSNICQKLPGDIKEDKGEVQGDQSEKGVDLRDGGLFLQVVQSWVLGKLLINLSDVALRFVLEGRHVEWRVLVFGMVAMKRL